MAFLTAAGCATMGLGQGGGGNTLTEAQRFALIKRAGVWTKTNVASMNLATGPQGQGAFARDQLVTCDYVDKKLAGRTPKFACAITAEDEVKVKYGADNGEVYAEVAATRLLWALGFGADAMYPVRVQCRGCPAKLGGEPGPNGSRTFAVAAIERKTPGRDLKTRDVEGWSWKELDHTDVSQGGADVATRDALKLLAAFIQHGDNKPQQQRLICRDDGPAPTRPETCERPYMLVSDLGVTFGRANLFNRQETGSVNLDRWSRTPVWRDEDKCLANLSETFTGTMSHPQISEEGRAFLASLMTQLTDAQLRAVFEVARFARRPRAPDQEESGRASVADWVGVFKQKRAAVVQQTCTSYTAK